MGKVKDQRTLEQILSDAACVLFPAHEESPPMTVVSQNSMGDTPLHVFLWRGDDYAARILISAGANVDATGEMAETPLHVAARKATSETIALLLAAGANETLLSEFGETPYQLAKLQDREDVYKQARLLANDLRRATRRRAGKREA